MKKILVIAVIVVVLVLLIIHYRKPKTPGLAPPETEAEKQANTIRQHQLRMKLNQQPIINSNTIKSKIKTSLNV